MRNNKGITLVEIMVVSMITVFMLLTVTAVFASYRGAWLLSQIKTDLYSDARKAMDTIKKDLMEGSSGDVGIFTFLDTATGEYMQGIWFASSRGNMADPGEDGSANNYYMHLSSDNVASWRSVIIYCSYETGEGVRQLKRYVDYGPSITHYSQANIFPLTFVSSTPAYLNFQKADGTALNISRAQGQVLANNLGNEDANNNNSLDAAENDLDISLPVDNGDGFLNLGFNAAKNPGRVDVALFLTKEVTSLQSLGRVQPMTLRSSIKFRQP